MMHTNPYDALARASAPARERSIHRFLLAVGLAVALAALAPATATATTVVGDSQATPIRMSGATLRPTQFDLGAATTEATDPKPSCATGAAAAGTMWVAVPVPKAPAATVAGAGRLLRIQASTRGGAALVAVYAVAPQLGTEVVCKALPAPTGGVQNGALTGLDQTVTGGLTYWVLVAAQAAGPGTQVAMSITIAQTDNVAVSPLPARRQAPLVAAIGSTVYSIGGLQTSYVPNAQSGFHSQAIDALSPRNGRWSTVAQLPVGLSYGRAVVVAGKVWMPGGRGNLENGAGCIVGTTFVFDPKTRAVTTGAPQPAPTLYDYAAAADPATGTVYQVGGLWDPTPCDVGGANDVQVAAFARSLDTKAVGAAAWTTLPVMPTPRAGAATAFVDGSLFVIGGLQGSTARGEVEAYTPRTRTWAKLPPMPLAVYEPSFGIGEGADGHLQVVIAGGWTSGGVLPVGVTGAGTAVPPGEVGIVQVYDPYSGTWSIRAGALGMPRDAAGSAVAAGRLWSVGGYAGQPVRSVESLVVDRHAPTVVVRATVAKRRVRLTAYVQDASGAGAVDWSFPRGSLAAAKLLVGHGPNVVRTFARAGTFTVSVVARDAVGNATAKRVRVTVQ